MRLTPPTLACLALCAALCPWGASASQKTDQECLEGAQMMANAAIARDGKKITREAFMAHMHADLKMVRGLPRTVRWFASDRADEAFLITQAELVFDKPQPPNEHEAGFLSACKARGVGSETPRELEAPLAAPTGKQTPTRAPSAPYPRPHAL